MQSPFPHVTTTRSELMWLVDTLGRAVVCVHVEATAAERPNTASRLGSAPDKDKLVAVLKQKMLPAAAKPPRFASLADWLELEVIHPVVVVEEDRLAQTPG
eukprot:m.144543 g.144543  ORF g.144543 m.144543 type:complete len:101 (+) comp23036_c0_seq1:101-403(+)